MVLGILAQACATGGATPAAPTGPIELDGTRWKLIALGGSLDGRVVQFKKRGAEVLLVPAAFTLTTGKEHWEALLRARAIETQCYVVAAAQTGRHNEKRDTYGHAMIIDPWGTVVAELDGGDGVIVAPLDGEAVAKTRRQMPCRQHASLWK